MFKARKEGNTDTNTYQYSWCKRKVFYIWGWMDRIVKMIEPNTSSNHHSYTNNKADNPYPFSHTRIISRLKRGSNQNRGEPA
jgi:hypothetical protein